MVSVSSPRSSFASSRAADFQARIALTAGCSPSPSSTAALPMSVLVSAISEVRLVLAPVQDALAHNVVEPHGNKAQVNHHLPEAEEPLAGEAGQFAVDHRPGHHENRFHVEQDEQHGHHIEAHAEALPGIAHGHNPTFVGGQLDRRVAVPPDEPGGYHHYKSKSKRCKDLQKQRKILPVVGDHRRPVQKIAPGSPKPKTASK